MKLDAEIKVRIPEDQKQTLLEIAKIRGTGTNVSDLVREAIDFYLSDQGYLKKISEQVDTIRASLAKIKRKGKKSPE